LDAAKNFYKDKTLPKEVEEFKVPVDLSELVGDMNLMKLQEIFKSIMKRQVERIDPVRAKFGKIEKEEVSMEEEMEKMEAYVRTHKHFSFREILAGSHSKLKMIVVFLTILEFMKMGKITITQEDIFDDIIIESCLE
jgi:segregation and condensation protein A